MLEQLNPWSIVIHVHIYLWGGNIRVSSLPQSTIIAWRKMADLNTGNAWAASLAKNSQAGYANTAD